MKRRYLPSWLGRDSIGGACRADLDRRSCRGGWKLTWHLAEQQIDDTVGVMRENINKVSQRGERLDSLQDKTDNLAVSAQGFRRGANRVRKQMWWKDMKMRMLLIVGIIILLVIIIVPIGRFFSVAASARCVG